MNRENEKNFIKNGYKKFRVVLNPKVLGEDRYELYTTEVFAFNKTEAKSKVYQSNRQKLPSLEFKDVSAMELK